MRVLPRRRLFIIGVVAIAGILGWLQASSLDGLQGLVLTALLRQDTAYATGYTDRGLRAIRMGMTREQVRTLVGEPLGVMWSYPSGGAHACTRLHFADGEVTSWSSDECERLGVRSGLRMTEMFSLLGAPETVYWRYSESPADTHYRRRVVRFSNGQVDEIITGWYLD